MKNKVLLFLVFSFAVLGSVSAKSVDEATALTVATHFYAKNCKHAAALPTAAVAYAAPSLRGKGAGCPSFYVVNFGSEGFVIVAGDDRVRPILAFSDEGAFVVDNMPAHISFFLDGYTAEVQYVVDNQPSDQEAVEQQWKSLLSDSYDAPKDGNVVVGPLLGNNKWTQTKYYNALCPVDSTGNSAYGGHAAVGCGAIVMGQVMRYWRYPTTGNGRRSYNSSRYGTLSANFGATTYRFENMPDALTAAYHPDSCVEAVATLLYHCGVAVKMNYGPSASVANSNNIVSALSGYFRYPATVRYLERSGVSSSQWLDYLKGELDEGAPFMYGGSGSYGGHVWTCDGYKDNDYFHFNWGWGGQQNGYYSLNNCSSYGFNSSHAIIIGIRGPELPQAIDVLSAEHVKLYPNPSNGMVYVRTELQQVLEVQILDLSGRLLSRKSVAANAFAVDMSGYAAGTYILRLVTDKGMVTSRIVKM